MAFASVAPSPLSSRSAAVLGVCGVLLVASSLLLWKWELAHPWTVQRFVRTWIVDPASDPVLTRVWWALSDLGHGTFLVALFVAILVPRGSPRLVQDALLLVGGASLIANLLKLGIGRARPGDADLHSWPSGHATAGLAVALCCALRPRLLLFAVPIAVLAGAARVVRERHWPSDVLGGFGIACLVAALCARLPTFLAGAHCLPRHRIVLAGALAAYALSELALARYVHGMHGYLNLLVLPCVFAAALGALRLAMPSPP